MSQIDFPELKCECIRGKNLEIHCNWLGKRYEIKTTVGTLYIHMCGFCRNTLKAMKPYWQIFELPG